MLHFRRTVCSSLLKVEMNQQVVKAPFVIASNESPSSHSPSDTAIPEHNNRALMSAFVSGCHS